jgi:transcriptional regulator with XRE-family HTH domain
MDRRLTQRQGARILGTTPPNVCSWERNKAAPATKSVPAIIRFLGYDPRPTPERFGQRIVHLRGTYGLSQRELAKLLRVDTLTVRRWENDQHQPAKKLLQKLEQMFPPAIPERFILNSDGLLPSEPR